MWLRVAADMFATRSVRHFHDALRFGQLIATLLLSIQLVSACDSKRSATKASEQPELWVSVARSPTAEIFVSPSSLRRTGDKALIWAGLEVSEPLEMEGKKARSWALLIDVDCAAQTLRVEDARAFASPQRQGLEERIAGEKIASRPVPGTPFYELVRHSCEQHG